MRLLQQLSIAGLIAFATLWLGWRLLSRRYVVPCPPWMWWVMENPYVELVASSQAIINRLDLQSGMTVLDIGAGSGRITLSAANSVGQFGTVVALDVQQPMLEKVQRRAQLRDLKNIRYLVAEISGADLEENSVDRAVMVIMLGEIPDRLKALQNVYAWLKPGGVLSVTESLPDPQYQRRQTVLHLADEAGFERLAEYGTFWSFTLNFRKPGEPEDQVADRSDPAVVRSPTQVSR